jgi:hypothetical protein
MAAMNSRRIVFVLGVLMVLVLPSMAAAQSSTFIITFDRTGTPGFKTIDLVDPMSGVVTPTVVQTGAFVNPCTLENVDVRGTSTITTNQTVDKWGNLKVSVSEVSKGAGAGWLPAADGTQLFTASRYAFSDSQSFTFQLPTIGEEFSSDFSDKFQLRGAKAVDNWTIRAHFRIKVNADGTVQVFMIKTSDGVCKG